MVDVHRTVQTLMEHLCVDAEMATISTLITEHVHVCSINNRNCTTTAVLARNSMLKNQCIVRHSTFALYDRCKIARQSGF